MISTSSFIRVFATCILLVVVSLSLSGCVLVPFISSAKDSGVLQSDRERLLQEQVVKFHRTRFWGKPFEALAYATPDARPRVQDFLRKYSKNERVVESEVEYMNFENDAFEASVAARVKYYRIPYYVVEERIEMQDWSFSMASGWQLVDVQVDKALDQDA